MEETSTTQTPSKKQQVVAEDNDMVDIADEECKEEEKKEEEREGEGEEQATKQNETKLVDIDDMDVRETVPSKDDNMSKASPPTYEEYLKGMQHAVSHYKAVLRLVTGGYSWNVPNDDKCKELASLIMKIQGPFCMKKFIRPSHLTKEITINIDGEPVGTLFNLDIDKIVSKATVAPFGRGSETIVDPSVRNALEITADRLSTTIDMTGISSYGEKKSNFDFVFNPLKWFYDAHDLAPRNLHLKAKPYKLHIYPKGGKFEPHVDTSHGKGHHATLVAILPTEYEGGELVVEHGGKEAVIGGAEDEKTDTAGAASEEKMIKMGCFYTDCTHRVLPVTSGTRIALQWDLFLSEKCGNYDPVDRIFSSLKEVAERERGDMAPRLADDPAFVESFVAAVDKLVQKHEKNNLAIILRHHYPVHSLATSMLRGGDQGLYDVLKRVCSARGTAEPMVIPVVINYESYRYEDADDPIYVGVSPFDSAMLDEKFSSTDFGKISQEKAICVFGSLGDHLEQLHYRQYAERTGNESQSETGSYMSAALVIRCQ